MLDVVTALRRRPLTGALNRVVLLARTFTLPHLLSGPFSTVEGAVSVARAVLYPFLVVSRSRPFNPVGTGRLDVVAPLYPVT